MNKQYNYVFKFIIIGDATTGKSSMLHAYTHQIFDSEIGSTVGIEFGSSIIDLELVQNKIVHKDTVKVQIWDTAGQERYQAVTAAYYRGSVGVFIVYDITSRESFDNVTMWYNKFMDRNPDHITTQFIIIGNKADKTNQREVMTYEGKELAESLEATFYEITCKKPTQINDIMKNMALQVYSLVINTNKNKNIIGIRKYNIQSNKHSYCCT